MTNENSCKCCKGLYSLAAECAIVTLTLVHVLLSAIELMIHLDVIQVPSSEADDDPISVTNATTSPSSSYDPGGCDTSLHPKLTDTVEIARYITLVLSALFFIEIACKAFYLKKYFFKDLWQWFDTFIVLLSLGVEIAFFLVHEKLLCYNPATEAATFVIILRLWRIPRACSVRRNEYKARLEDEHRYLRQTKRETEKKCKDLEKAVQNQTTEIQNLKSILRKSNVFVTEESERMPNGSAPINGGLNAVAVRTLQVRPLNSNECNNKEQTEQFKGEINKTFDTKTETDLERNDSDKNSRANDSGIEVKDSFRSDKEVTAVYNKVVDNDDEVFDSDGSEFPVPVKTQEVEVQIEEISRQNQLPSVTSYQRSVLDEDGGDDPVVLLRRKTSTSAAACVNAGYDAGEDEPDYRGTYRSADGIPMTEL